MWLNSESMANARWERSAKNKLVVFRECCMRGGRRKVRIPWRKLTATCEAHLQRTQPGRGSLGESGNGRRREKRYGGTGMEANKKMERVDVEL